MSQRRAIPVKWAASAWCLLALAACGGGGGAKEASSPGTCPDGTVLSGEDCLPESAAGSKSGAAGSAKASPPEDSTGSGGASSSGGAAYDKDAVDVQLKRAAKQVRDNCGSASDEDGNKTGPWGSTTATLVLGRNGHIADVTVPAPYSGKPVGDCVVRSFKKIQFPPYAGSSDVTVTWDVEIKEPKSK
ncbi:MAG TPA: hypothetical protein VE987_12880 [Polyangiaceae bacterium]|nr:hypothetical protein [Polyangiaceae bacterium]